MYLGQARQARSQRIEQVDRTREAGKHVPSIEADPKIQLLRQVQHQFERELDRLDRDLPADNAGIGQNLLDAAACLMLELPKNSRSHDSRQVHPREFGRERPGCMQHIHFRCKG